MQSTFEREVVYKLGRIEAGLENLETALLGRDTDYRTLAAQVHEVEKTTLKTAQQVGILLGGGGLAGAIAASFLALVGAI